MSKGIVWVRKLPFAIWKKDAAKALSSFRDDAAVEGVNFFKANFEAIQHVSATHVEPGIKPRLFDMLVQRMSNQG
jgi:hypothetical protein